MVESLFKALAAGLSIWQTAQARKYKRKVLKLWREYDELINLPDDQFDDNALFHVESELMRITEIFANEASASLGKSNIKD